MMLSKYHFSTKETKYLGHFLSITGIKPLPTKTEAIRVMQATKECQTGMGLYQVIFSIPE